MGNTFTSRSTLKEVITYLRANWDKGTNCPACKQRVQKYRRTITRQMANALISVAKASPERDWVYFPDVIGRQAHGDECKLKYWGIIEGKDERRDDGGPAGWWRMTELGEQWLRGQVRVPKYAEIYNGRCRGLIDTETISIEDALRHRFSYRELMNGQ